MRSVAAEIRQPRQTDAIFHLGVEKRKGNKAPSSLAASPKDQRWCFEKESLTYSVESLAVA